MPGTQIAKCLGPDRLEEAVLLDLIRIRFMDFWKAFDPENNFILDILGTRYEVVQTGRPDFLFCSVFGHEHLQYDCPRICLICENAVPDFNACDYAVGMNDLQFGDRYLRCLLNIAAPEDSAVVRAAQEKHLRASERIKTKDGFCSFVYSNSHYSDPKRMELLNALRGAGQVDCGGSIENNVGGKVADKIAFEGRHRFSVACENGSQPGYCTEKILESFAACTVPIYWGDPDVARIYNENAFIDCGRFADFGAVAAEVARIDGDEGLYGKMLSQPAFAAGFDPREHRRCLEDYLLYIVGQEPERALRRCRWGWAKPRAELERNVHRLDALLTNHFRTGQAVCRAGERLAELMDGKAARETKKPLK